MSKIKSFAFGSFWLKVGKKGVTLAWKSHGGCKEALGNTALLLLNQPDARKTCITDLAVEDLEIHHFDIVK